MDIAAAKLVKVAVVVALALTLGLFLVALPGAWGQALEEPVPAAFSLTEPSLEEEVGTLDAGANWRQECDGIAVRYHMGRFLRETHEPATGRKYRGGTSWVRHYRHGQCHCITRNGNVLHGPHPRAIGDPQ